MLIHAYIRFDNETSQYYVIIPELPGVYTQGETVDECIKNTYEAVELALEEEEDREYFGIFGDVSLEFLIHGEKLHVG